MADKKPQQEGAFKSPRYCLTSGGRQAIAYPPNLQRLEMSVVYNGHETRPPESTYAARESATFDFTAMTNEVVSIDFVSLATLPTDQPVTTLYDKNATARHTNDSSPHLNDRKGNPTAYATSTTAFESQQIYHRPKKYMYPEMASYSAKLKTFQDWPRNHGPRVEDLVGADMFYQGAFIEAGEEIRDQVVCFKCGTTIRQWESTDDPVVEHKRIYMKCFDTKWVGDL